MRLNYHCPEFTPKVVQKWKSRGFEWEDTKDWISSGMKANDAGFCAWLRDEVKFDSDRVLNLRVRWGSARAVPGVFIKNLVHKVNQQVQTDC